MNPCPPQPKTSCWSSQKFSVGNELRQGRQATTGLLGLIRQQKDLSGVDAVSLELAFGLVMKIIDSFSNSLSMLGCQDPATGGPGEMNKSAFLYCGSRGRCPKPKSLCNRKGDSWTQVTSAPTADGYAWKKYGQKSILNAKHPRSYFKCINKPHCQALKRVQKMDDDDDTPMYRILRTGHHTCEFNPSNSSSFGYMDSTIDLFNFKTENNMNVYEPNSSGGVADHSQFMSKKVRGEECKTINNNPSSFEAMESITSPENVQNLDDYDNYLIDWMCEFE
ncbi:hypothetical protein QQ045_032924 [Rhodiola kirilowii]